MYKAFRESLFLPKCLGCVNERHHRKVPNDEGPEPVWHSLRALATPSFTPRTGGRVVECTGLENRRAARYRGFESLPVRFW